MVNEEVVEVTGLQNDLKTGTFFSSKVFNEESLKRNLLNSNRIGWRKTHFVTLLRKVLCVVLAQRQTAIPTRLLESPSRWFVVRPMKPPVGATW